MPAHEDRKAGYESEKSNRWPRIEEGKKCISEVRTPMECVKRGIYRHYTKKCERQGCNGGSQDSQGHHEVDRHSAINAPETHH